MPQLATWWKYKVFGPKYFWTQFALPVSLIIGRQKPDVFFSPGHYRPRWSPIPTVVSIMDLGYLRFPDQFTKRDLMQLKMWTSHSIKKANYILAISEATKNDIVEFYGIPSARIKVTYPGYDKKRFHSRIKVNRKVLEKYGIRGDYILYIGTLKPSKNIEGLLEAFKLFISHYSLIINLVVAGKKGWLYESIFQKVKDTGLEDRVVVTDYIDERDKPQLMASAKVIVSPSFWEGFGINLVEAMAVGTPVVASNVGSVPEVVDRAGVLVNPKSPRSIAQGIQKALTHREVYVKRGLDRTRDFSWQKTARQTLEVLEKVANQV